MAYSSHQDFFESVRSEFLRYKRLGAASIDVLDEKDLNFNPNDANSIAVVVKHLHGNMRSRWTNMFTEDGEKPYRNRDAEFETEHLSKEKITHLYNEGWSYLETMLSTISEQDFAKPVVIRGETLTLIQAFNRQLTHCAYHVGQIVFIAKQCKGEGWKSLSIPKGRSSENSQGSYLEK